MSEFLTEAEWQEWLGRNMPKPCYALDKPALEIGNVAIFAGPIDRLRRETLDLRFELVDPHPMRDEATIRMTRAVEASMSAVSLMLPEVHLPTFETEPFAFIAWPDFREPYVSPEFWRALVEGFGKREEALRVGFGCAGGRGRTGSALAILASLAGKTAGYLDPVQWVRDTYCENAVESAAQIEYIGQVTGEVMFSAPVLERDAWVARFSAPSETPRTPNSAQKALRRGQAQPVKRRKGRAKR